MIFERYFTLCLLSSSSVISLRSPATVVLQCPFVSDLFYCLASGQLTSAVFNTDKGLKTIYFSLARSGNCTRHPASPWQAVISSPAVSVQPSKLCVSISILWISGDWWITRIVWCVNQNWAGLTGSYNILISHIINISLKLILTDQLYLFYTWMNKPQSATQ